MKKFLIAFSLVFFISSCSSINFVYQNDKSLYNPIYKLTSYSFEGKELSSMYRFLPIYIGRSDSPKYSLKIKIIEDTTSKSVKKNQAITELGYKLTFEYSLEDIKNNCTLLDVKLFSRFSHAPKSSGYNFGSDQSLENLYELAVKDNIERFVDLISKEKFSECLDEN